MWFGIVGFLAWASGWRRLARTYGGMLPEGFDGEMLNMATLGRGRFPRVHYRRALEAQFETGQLLLKPHVLFRWAHPPLVIPRTEIEARVRKGLLRKFCEVSTRAHPGIGLHLQIRQFGWPEDLAQEE